MAKALGFNCTPLVVICFKVMVPVAVLITGVVSTATKTSLPGDPLAKPESKPENRPESASEPKPEVAKKDPGKVISKTLVSVGGQYITSREVLIGGVFESWLLFQQVLKRKDSKIVTKLNGKDWFLKSDSAAYVAQLNQLVLEALLVLDADQFSISKVSDEEIQAKADAFLLVVREMPDWKSLEANEGEIRLMVSRKMRAQAYIQFLTDTRAQQVTDQDVQAYYQKNRVKFGQFPLADFKESIREKLTQQQQEERLRDRLDALRKKHKVRFLNRGAAL